MLDFADVVAINKFERRGAEDALRDVRRQLARNREAFAPPPDELPVFGTDRRPLQRRRRHRALPAPARPLPTGGRTACRSAPARSPGSTARRRPADTGHRPAGPGALPRRDRRDGPRLPRARTAEQAAVGPAPPAGRPMRLARGRRRRRRGVDSPELEAAAELAASASRGLLDGWPADRRGLLGRLSTSPTVRGQRARAPQLHRGVAVGHARAPGRAAPLHRPRRAAALAARREPARPLPVHRRRVPVQARRRGPGPHVRRRGRRRSAPTGGSTCSPRASPPPACRPRSTRSRSTASTPTSAPTSTARSATPACRSPPSTT